MNFPRNINFEMENYTHDIIMFVAELIVKSTLDLSLRDIAGHLAERGNIKRLKKIAPGEKVEDRLKIFLWQHPSIFSITNELVHLRSMSPQLDEELEIELEKRTLDFLIFRCCQYGQCQILISKLFGNLHQAANDIKHYFYDFSKFFNFIKSFPEIFIILDDNYVVLKNVYDNSLLYNRTLPKCNEYLIDERVIHCTKIITNIAEANAIISYVQKTKTVVAIDCEGVNLGSFNSCITLVQLAYSELSNPNNSHQLGLNDLASNIKIYLFDVQANRNILVRCLRKLLQNHSLVKIFQGCSGDAMTLQNKYGITLKSVFDTSVAHKMLHHSEKSDLYYLYENYVGETTNRMKKDIKKQYINNPRLWTTRPLSDHLIYYAAFDVYALIRIYYAMLPKIDPLTYNIIFRESNSIAAYSVSRFELSYKNNPNSSNFSNPSNDQTKRPNFNYFYRPFYYTNHYKYHHHPNHFNLPNYYHQKYKKFQHNEEESVPKRLDSKNIRSKSRSK